jgi:hypothetical protein
MFLKQKIVTSLCLATLCLFTAPAAFAHQPRIVADQPNMGEEMNQMVVVENPDVSQAFYGEFNGQDQWFQLQSDDTNFVLLVSLLVPKIENTQKNISASIFSIDANGNQEEIAQLDGTNFEWTEFYEPFGGDTYYQGPEFKEQVGAGKYLIRVYNPSSQGKYVFVVGQKESFPLKEQLNTIFVLPQLKHDFFNRSALSAYSNYVGVFMLAVVTVAVILVLLVILVVKKLKRKK